jgi:hypothetical protein
VELECQVRLKIIEPAHLVRLLIETRLDDGQSVCQVLRFVNSLCMRLKLQQLCKHVLNVDIVFPLALHVFGKLATVVSLLNFIKVTWEVKFYFFLCVLFHFGFVSFGPFIHRFTHIGDDLFLDLKRQFELLKRCFLANHPFDNLSLHEML